MKPVSAAEVAEHINKTNPHSGESRDAWAGISLGWDALEWSVGPVNLTDLPEVHPASKKDVKRYAAHAKRSKREFPAVVVAALRGKTVVLDGAHRIAAARLLGDKTIDAYVGLSA